MAEDSPAVAALVEVIQQGIADRGFYLLMDERRKLICGGEEINPHDLRHVETINVFAEKHQWRAKPSEIQLCFRPLAR
jgi:hypothetical protein